VYIYGSYRKIETGVSLLWTTLYTCILEPYNTIQCMNYTLKKHDEKLLSLSISLLNHSVANTLHFLV